jgi:hypothetical protein
LQRIPGEHVFFDNLPANEMPLNDFLKNFRCAGVVPHALRVNDGDWTIRADAKAVGFGAIDERFRAGELQFLEPAFQVFPRAKAFLSFAALRFALVGAKEDMALVLLDTEFFYEFPQVAHNFFQTEQGWDVPFSTV